jgi:hypothetical protein
LRALVPACLIVVLSAACSRDFIVTNLDDGSHIYATLNVVERELTLTLPDGETAVGTVGMLTTHAIGEGSLFFGANVGRMLGRNVGVERLYGHVRAIGTRNTTIEAVLTVDWLGHGFGIAKTADGRQWPIAF